MQGDKVLDYGELIKTFKMFSLSKDVLKIMGMWTMGHKSKGKRPMDLYIRDIISKSAIS